MRKLISRLLDWFEEVSKAYADAYEAREERVDLIDAARYWERNEVCDCDMCVAERKRLWQ